LEQLMQHPKRMAWRRCRLGSVVASIAAVATLLASASYAGAAPPPGRPPGPALTTPPQALAAALSCPQGVRGDRDPVLLAPGPSGRPDLLYGADLEPVLRAHGYSVCAVYLPDAGFGDLQIQAEYVVAAIREIAVRSGRSVSVFGASQGALPPRWALKWWPDLRFLVGDFIGLSPNNHGDALAALCNPLCPPATRQGLPGSRFLGALNQGDETPGGGRVSYSVITSADDVSVPAPFSTLQGEADDSNTSIQAICPGRPVGHANTNDAVVVALVLDALGHDGPARASRIPTTECAKTYADGIDPDKVKRHSEAALQVFVAGFINFRNDVEPPLKPYVSGSRRSAWRP
jgi:hypothetical protein